MNIVVLYEKNDSEIMFDNKTLFQKTLLRFKYFLLKVNRYIIVCEEEDYLIVQKQIKELNFNKDYTIIIEPMGKGTLASVITGVLSCDRIETSLVVSCDYIFDDKEICDIIENLYNNYTSKSIYKINISLNYSYKKCEYYMFKNNLLLDYSEEYALDIYTLCLNAAMKSLGNIDNNTITLNENDFLICPKFSLDDVIKNNITNIF